MNFLLIESNPIQFYRGAIWLFNELIVGINSGYVLVYIFGVAVCRYAIATAIFMKTFIYSNRHCHRF